MPGSQVYRTIGHYKGHRVMVTSWRPCPTKYHHLGVMHHYGDDMKHYCPTGFLMCDDCGGVANEPQPYSCVLWGQWSTGEAETD